MNKREIILKRDAELKEWTKRRAIMLDDGLSFEEAKKIAKIEDEHYKKWVFLTKLCKEMGGAKNEDNNNGKRI